MARIAALGDPHRVRPLALAGVQTLGAVTNDEIVNAWSMVGPDVAVLILTRQAWAALADRLDERRSLLVTVLP